MVKKIKTEYSPTGFYLDEDMEKNKSSSYFALDKNATANEVARVNLLTYLNKLINKIESNYSEEMITEKMGADTIRRVKKYIYRELDQDLLWNLITISLEIIEKKKLSGEKIYNTVISNRFK